MKKMNLLSLGLIACSMCCLALPAMSDDNIFSGVSASAPKNSDLKTTVKVEEPVNIRGTSQMTQHETLTTQSLQSSISSLEAAQADLRTKLETAQANYNAVDKEYKRIKQERSALKKIVNKTKSRIKTLERNTKSIRKAIQTQQ